MIEYGGKFILEEHMVQAVALIPVSPLHSDKIGFYSLFVYAHKIARQFGCISLYGVNTVGKGDTGNSIPVLHEATKKLSIQPDRWWSDTCVTEECIQHLFTRLYTQNVIEIIECDVARCVCGNIEFFAHVTLQGGSKSLIKNGKASCCGSHLEKSRQITLCTNVLPPVNGPPNIYPGWARQEVGLHMRKLEGARMLVSRQTVRPYKVHIGGLSFWIDTDMLWALYQELLQFSGISLRHLVLGRSSLMQVCRILACNTLIGSSQIETIHMLPKIQFSPVHGINTLDMAVERFGYEKVVNMLLWGALSERKELTLQGSMLPRFSPLMDSCGEIFSCRRNLLL